MLSLFQTEEIQWTQEDALVKAKEVFNSSLNKGRIIPLEDYLNSMPDYQNEVITDVVKRFYRKFTDWDFLTDVLKQEATEFLCHHPEQIQILKPNGEREFQTINLDINEWQMWLEIISIRFHQTWNMENPFVSFYGKLAGCEFRITMIHYSTSPQGLSKLILRKISSEVRVLRGYQGNEALSEFIKNQNNVLIAGSTGSGKTTLLSSMVSEIPEDEHLIILEDTYEIICHRKQVTRLLASQHEKKNLYSYLSYSMRMSPDRIILGELRSHEIVPFVMAMNTGHKGLLATIHASSAYDALNRAALLFSIYSKNDSISFEKVMDLVCANLEYVVFMENKKIKEIIKILGQDKGRPFFERIYEA